MRKYMFLILTNLGVILTISLVTSLLGLGNYMSSSGINYTSLIGFCLIWGFSGAFISLSISRWMAKKTMGVKLIEENTINGMEKAIFRMVQKHAMAAGIKMPEVGIYQGMPNAFATGPSRDRALVAVSTGLIAQMEDSELEAVIAHEVAHVANGDMVISTLVQGVVNAFTMFLARVLAFGVATAMKDEDGHLSSGVQTIATIVFDLVFSVLGSIVVMYHSRTREFAADAGAARLMGSATPMIRALKALAQDKDKSELPSSIAAFGIKGGTLTLFSTHPSIESRIKALENFRPY